MKSRMIRLSAATLLIGAAGVTFWPQVVSYVSTSAVVNAPVVRVKAPFNGVVTSVSVGDAGTAVHRESPLLSLAQSRAATGAITALDAEAQVVATEIASLEVQIASVEAIAIELGQRIAAHRAEAGLWIAAKGEVLSADTEKAQAEHDLAIREFDRISRLAASGTIPGTQLDEARTQVSLARAALDRLRGETAKLKVEAAALDKGIMLDASAEGAGYARQRLDEVTLSLADLQSRLAVLKARALALATTRDETRTHLAAQHSFAPASAVEGVVWRAAPETGTEVAVGDTLVEIVDCERRFLEVSLPERYFERISPGDVATVQLKGSASVLTATVSAIGGSSVRLSDTSFAANRPEESGNAAQILLDLPPAASGEDRVTSGFCDVGRTAEVRFPRADVKGIRQQIVAALGDLGDRLLRLT